MRLLWRHTSVVGFVVVARVWLSCTTSNAFTTMMINHNRAMTSFQKPCRLSTSCIRGADDAEIGFGFRQCRMCSLKKNSLSIGYSTATTSTRMYMTDSGGNSNSGLSSTFDQLSTQLIERLGLQVTDFSESYDGKTWSSSDGAVSGTAEWLTETSPKFLTGVSLLTRQEKNQDQHNQWWTINVWLGPSYDVPHLLLTFSHKTSSASSGSSYSVMADYIPRGATPLGSDGQYLETYYGLDVQQAWTKAYYSSVSNTASPAMPSPAWTSRLLASPFRIDVDGLDETTALQLIQDHVNRLLSWLLDQNAQPIPARLRGSFNLRDDKLRQYYFRGQVQEQVTSLGTELGNVVAAVNTGPTAEAYVGGGS